MSVKFYRDPDQIFEEIIIGWLHYRQVYNWGYLVIKISQKKNKMEENIVIGWKVDSWCIGSGKEWEKGNNGSHGVVGKKHLS